MSVAEEDVDEADVEDAFADSTPPFCAKLAGTDSEEDICPVDLERTLRPFSCKLLLIESSSEVCEDMTLEEFDEVIEDFLR